MAAASVMIVMTVSTFVARAAGLGATLAPAATSGSHFSAERFHTVTLLPVSISRAAIAAPILPRPATPKFMRLLLTQTRRTIGDRPTGRKPAENKRHGIPRRGPIHERSCATRPHL